MYEKFIFKFSFLKNKINKNILNKINHLIKSKKINQFFYLKFSFNNKTGLICFCIKNI